MRLIARIVFSLLLFLPTSLYAETATVGINGLVCSFCAQGIKRTFSKEEAVESIDVDMEKKIVSIKIKSNKTLSDEKIKEIVTNAGFSTTNIERTK